MARPHLAPHTSHRFTLAARSCVMLSSLSANNASNDAGTVGALCSAAAGCGRLRELQMCGLPMDAGAAKVESMTRSTACPHSGRDCDAARVPGGVTTLHDSALPHHPCGQTQALVSLVESHPCLEALSIGRDARCVLSPTAAKALAQVWGVWRGQPWREWPTLCNPFQCATGFRGVLLVQGQKVWKLLRPEKPVEQEQCVRGGEGRFTAVIEAARPLSREAESGD
eukprot:365506-Chlamydomonas_euryale.AAC.4